ncbi:MAG TPA: hypothetical protein VFS20_02190 [Longimicrobium sp.]|nr:hypothetical protein [Longimicrobium sp.]
MSSVLPSGIAARGDHACGRDALPGGSVPGQSFAGSAAVAAAVLAQASALAWLADAGGGIVPAGVAAAGACSFAWRRRARLAHADVVIATAAFGGLGMMAGEWVARSGSATAHHAGMAHGPPAPGAWITASAVMLLTCAAACRWSCAPLCHGGWMRTTAAHGIAAGGMLAGMAAAGAVLATPLGSVLGAAAGVHLAMVLGMTAGVAAVLPLIGMMDPKPRILEISR